MLNLLLTKNEIQTKSTSAQYAIVLQNLENWSCLLDDDNKQNARAITITIEFELEKKRKRRVN